MQASDILTEAAGIVAGARNTTHGEKERSFVVIASLWNAYLDGRRDGGPVTPRDVAQLMALLKIGRSIQGTAAADHFTDQCGYSAIAGELAATEPRQATACSFDPHPAESELEVCPKTLVEAIFGRCKATQDISFPYAGADARSIQGTGAAEPPPITARDVDPSPAESERETRLAQFKSAIAADSLRRKAEQQRDLP